MRAKIKRRSASDIAAHVLASSFERAFDRGSVAVEISSLSENVIVFTIGEKAYTAEVSEVVS